MFGATTAAAPVGQPAGFGGSFGATGASVGFGGGFGAAKPAFGQPAAVGGAPQTFGNTPFGSGGGGGVFGSAAPSTSPFGGGMSAPFAAVPSGGFGTAFGAPSSIGSAAPNAPIFGQQSSVFGQQPPVGGAVSPFGQPAAAPAVAASPFGAFGAAPVQQQLPQGSPFGQLPAMADGGMEDGNGEAIAVSASPEETAAWQAAAFEKRKIPEHAPPQVFCR